RQSNSSLIRPDTVPDSKAIRRKRSRQRAAKIALTLHPRPPTIIIHDERIVPDNLHRLDCISDF
ncbi:hypothetical protein NKJ84_28160, partial [Mesorhizobium sp. M0048]|uniref:hypothetical protein n=1 Tax=Mesorhizobium sp. M0048 TaxID=2956860 RepID=UPI00333B7979